MHSPLSLLCPVILQAHYQLIQDIYKKSRTFSSDNPTAFVIMMDELIRLHIRDIRTKLYKVITSDTFKEAFAEVEDVLELDISDFQKTVFCLIVLDMSLEETYMITLSGRESIMTIRSVFKKNYPLFFIKSQSKK